MARFLDELARVHRSLRGAAELETLEQWLTIRVTAEVSGHMECRCTLRDQPGIGNTLDGAIATDQTFIRRTVAELGAAVQAFPVIGRP